MMLKSVDDGEANEMIGDELERIGVNDEDHRQEIIRKVKMMVGKVKDS